MKFHQAGYPDAGGRVKAPTEMGRVLEGSLAGLVWSEIILALIYYVIFSLSDAEGIVTE